MMTDPDRLLSAAAVREMLGGIGRTMLYDLVRAGRLPSPIKLGTRSFWRYRDIAGYIARLSPSASGERGDE